MRAQVMVIDGCKRLFAKRTFPEENKAKFHRFGIENVLYEVNKAFTPHLTVIDGTIGVFLSVLLRWSASNSLRLFFCLPMAFLALAAFSFF